MLTIQQSLTVVGKAFEEISAPRHSFCLEPIQLNNEPLRAKMNQATLAKRKKILVVEDQIDLLDMLRMQFKEEGFSTATATDGVEAVRKARALVPDLVLLDVMLPELDGFAVCEMLRNDPHTRDIPIIMVSGLAGQLPRCVGIEAGATEFVTKPVTPNDLVTRVRQIFEQRAAAEGCAVA
ncbi:MAG TPA: response regulator [Candidatus Paceibacterota bacterium]|nr:response regulator [Candidatus Paceibacterota bacterium]